jgi:hypothetical protein
MGLNYGPFILRAVSPAPLKFYLDSRLPSQIGTLCAPNETKIGKICLLFNQF